MRHCLLGVADVHALCQGHDARPHGRPAGVVPKHGGAPGAGPHWRPHRRHAVAHGRPVRAMPHLQRLRQRLPAGRGRVRHHAEVGQLQGRERLHPASHAGRPGRPERQLDGAERPGAVRDDRQGRQGGADDAAGVHRLGVPRHGHVPGRPHRGGRREEDPDQGAQAGAPDDHLEQDKHRPPGGRRGHGRHLQVCPAVQVRQVLAHDPLADAEPAPGARGLRRHLPVGGRELPLQPGPQPGLVLRLRRHQRPRHLLGPELHRPARRRDAVDEDDREQEGARGPARWEEPG
mmetsp:Transcript_114119/g.368676  ORF Transcript_114119/g.368676 Transcript_114119/m.368676 type:complete len:289 (+) Transcript_114119:1601-2467(+)